MRPKLTYANVVSTLCLVLLLGGGAAYAASHLGKNSVGPKQLKKNAITTAKIKNEAVTAAKVKKATLTGQQIDTGTLGTVPNAQTAQTAQTASTIAPPEPWHEVGAPGEPDFFSGWENLSDENVSAGFYKDHEGIVHLKGMVKAPPATGEPISLAPGFRPTPGKDFQFIGYCAVCGTSSSERILVVGSDYTPMTSFSGVVAAGPAAWVSLDGITFRAES